MSDFIFELQRFAEGKSINNSTPSTLLTGTDYNDTIMNDALNVTINAGKGNDSIENYRAHVSIQAGEGNDTIINNGNGVLSTIHGGKGDDYIINNSDWGIYKFEIGDGNDTIEGFNAYNDNIVFQGDTAIVKNENGNAFLSYSGGEVTVKDLGDRPWHLWGHEGKNTFHNFVNGETLEGGGGSDTLVNHGAQNVVFKHFNGDGNDSIVGFNETSKLVIGKNSDRDDVEVYYKKHYTEEDVLVGIYYSKPINDSITADYTITLKGAASLPSINVDGVDITPNNPLLVRLTRGDDTRENTLNNATLFAYGGADSVTNTGANVLIDAGKGDDFIFNDGGKKVTINAGTGNDIISLSSGGRNNLIKYAPGDGSDSILGFNSTTTLQIGSGEWDTYASVKSDNDILVTVGSDVITLVGAAKSPGKILGKEIKVINLTEDADTTPTINSTTNVMIRALGGDDEIRNNANYVTVDAGAGDDTVINNRNGSSSFIEGGDGKDFITNYASFVTIQSGAGDDTVRILGTSGNYPSQISISTGDGNDSIINYGTNATIYAGKGNDRISLSGGQNLIVYHEGDGNDLITNFKSSDALMIVGAVNATYLPTISGNDFLVCVGNDTITLKGAANMLPSIRTKVDASILEEITVDTTPADIFTEGNDSYNDSVDGVELLALGGDDSIHNYGNSVTIDGGVGDDSINTFGDSVLVYGRAGNDSIENRGNSVTIDSGDGNNYVLNKGNNVKINTGAGNDIIDNVGASVSIDSGAGNDEIGNYAKNVSISTGAGKDDIYNDAENVTISAGDDDDTILSRTSFVFIDGGAGNDRIREGGASHEKVTVSGGDGDDYIRHIAVDSSLSGGAGNDEIRTLGSNTTINGGTGDDKISLGSYAKNDVIEYTFGDGNDTVLGFNDSDTLKIGNGTTDTYSKETVGADIVVTVGDGKISLVGSASLSAVNIAGTNKTAGIPSFSKTISLTAGNDTYNNTVTDVELLALGGNDTVTNRGGNVFVDLGAGTDTIFNDGKNVTISGGDGNDSIYNRGANVSINGGAGNDFISGDNIYTFSDGLNLTVTGGKGNDTVRLDSGNFGKVLVYNSGDGNDSVCNLKDSDTLLIADSSWTTTKSGKNLIVTVGDGKITLVGAATLSSVNIVSSAADVKPLNYIENSVPAVKLTGTNEKDFIYNDKGASVTIDSGAGNDFIINLGANVSINSGDGNDSIKNGKVATIVAGAGNDTIQAGYDSTVTAGTGNDIIFAAPRNVIEYTAGDGNDKIYDFNATSTLKIGGGTGTYSTTKSGNNLIVTVGDGKISLLGAASLASNIAGKLTIVPTAGNDTLSVSSGGILLDGGNGNDVITNTHSDVTLSGGDGNDTIISNGDGGNVYLFAATDGKDTIMGYSDDDTIKITDGTTPAVSVKGDNIIVTVGKGSMTLKDAAKNGTHVNVVNAKDETLIDETFYADRIVGNSSVTLTSAFKGKTFAANDSINAVDGSLTTNKFTLAGGVENDTLIGGKGANFISGGDGKNILTGGKGNDTFVAGLGNDTITDYGIGTDKISLGAALTDFSVENGDVVLNFDEGKSLTIQNGDGKKINFIQNGKTSTELFTVDGKMNTAKTSITLPSSTDSYTASKSMVTIDGGLTDSVWIVGNTKANKIFGGDNSDTLDGGKGNDTLTGRNGNDIFVYETGKDVITDYISGEDKISLGAATTSESLTSKGDVVLKFGSNSLTIKKVGDTTNGREITFTGEDGDTTKTYFSESIVGSDGVTLQSTFKGNTFAADDELPKVDASAVTKNFTLTGGNEDDTLIGGKGVNLFNGGGGNDLLIGNGGADTFVYSSGDDTIGDYGNGSDKVSLSSAIKDFDLRGDDVIIKFNDGSLTLQDSAGKQVTFVETVNGKVTTSVNVFAADGIFDSGKTAVTLAANTSSFDATSYSNLVSIDGGIVSNDVSIVGNAKNNLIHAGDAGSTINGGKGNDSLWGGDGSDTFIYESGGGKDTIYAFGNEDALQIGNFTATVKDKTISFNVGSQTNAIVLKDYTATTFNINNETYRINGNELKK